MNVPIDISGVRLETPRLVLRPWQRSDLEDFYEYASVDGVGQMAGWQPHESREKSAEILDMFIQGKKTFAIEAQGKAIGSVGIEAYSQEQLPELDGLRCREIGYVLSRDYWGRCLMPEAVRAVMDYLFREVGLDAILCGYFVWNRQSARVQEKCGFRYLKTVPYTTRMGTVEESAINILYRTEWEDGQK